MVLRLLCSGVIVAQKPKSAEKVKRQILLHVNFLVEMTHKGNRCFFFFHVHGVGGDRTI